MIRALLTFGINLVLAAVALLVVSFTTEGVTMQWSGLLWTVLVLALAQAVLAPFVFNLARKYASAVLGGIGIASTLLALWVATLASNGGLRINGLGAWVSTALIVWVITALGEWLLGWLVIRRWWDRRKQARQAGAAAARTAARQKPSAER